MQYLISALYFLGVLSVLVIAHEWGHFIAARLCGMRVDDFSLFFGKRLIRLGERNGTEYNIRSIPFGGFVKIAGMEPDDISNGVSIRTALSKKRKDVKSLIGLDTKALEFIDPEKISEQVDEAIYASIGADSRLTPEGIEALKLLAISKTITAEEQKYIEAVLDTVNYVPDPTHYNNKPILQRATVIFAGPFMSLLFGYLLYCGMGVTMGLPTVDNTIQVLVKDKANKPLPAEKAGLKPNDRIVSVNGTPINDGEQLIELIHNSTDKTPLNLLVKRGESEIPFTVTPYVDVIEGKSIGRLGFAPGSTWKRYGLVDSLGKGTNMMVAQVVGITQIFKKPKEIKDNVGGPIAIAGIIHEGGRRGFNHIVLTAALLSVSLGVINLFPIPILDGGHLLLLAIEGIRRRKLSGNGIYAAHMFGVLVIGMLFVFVMYNDLSRVFGPKH